jgi:hypothetical protein
MHNDLQLTLFVAKINRGYGYFLPGVGTTGQDQQPPLALEDLSQLVTLSSQVAFQGLIPGH